MTAHHPHSRRPLIISSMALRGFCALPGPCDPHSRFVTTSAVGLSTGSVMVLVSIFRHRYPDAGIDDRNGERR
jgi:hypothetical protein